MDTYVFIGLVSSVALLLLYLLPMCVAGFREHPNFNAITVLNIVAGWTFIGWVVALVWACLEIKRPAARVITDPPDPAPGETPEP